MGACNCQYEPNHIITTQYIENPKNKQNDQSSVKTNQNFNFLCTNKYSSNSTVNCVKYNPNMSPVFKKDRTSFVSSEENSFNLPSKPRPILNKLLDKNRSSSSLLKI